MSHSCLHTAPSLTSISCLLALMLWKAGVRKSASVTWRRGGAELCVSADQSQRGVVGFRSQQYQCGRKKKKKRERRRITVHSSLYGADSRFLPHRTRVSSCDEHVNRGGRRRWACFGGWREPTVLHCLRRNKNGLDVEGKRGFLSHIRWWQEEKRTHTHTRGKTI